MTKKKMEKLDLSNFFLNSQEDSGFKLLSDEELFWQIGYSTLTKNLTAAAVCLPVPNPIPTGAILPIMPSTVRSSLAFVSMTIA